MDQFITALTSLLHGSNPQPIPQPKLSFDQQMAAKGIFRWPDGIYREGTPSARPTSQPINIPSTNPSNGPFSPEAIKAGILRWSGGRTDVPVLNNVDTLYRAGQQFQQAGLDPYMPTIMSLRETQGGRDVYDPSKNKNSGSYNYYNIRNIRDPQTGKIIGQPDNPKDFINYPSFETATLGGNNNGVQQGGFVGQIFKSGLYDKYLKSRNMEDFFGTYSPPKDKNGAIPEQVQNYNWFRQRF